MKGFVDCDSDYLEDDFHYVLQWSKFFINGKIAITPKWQVSPGENSKVIDVPLLQQLAYCCSPFVADNDVNCGVCVQNMSAGAPAVHPSLLLLSLLLLRVYFFLAIPATASGTQVISLAFSGHH